MDNQTQPPNETESPRADDMQGAAGLPQTNEDDASATADQEIDTAGTDMDELSPTKWLGTGVAPTERRG